MIDLKLTDDDVARFWSKIDRLGHDDCWLWTGWKTPEGYGRLDIGKRKPLATRIALHLDNRPQPSANHFALHGDCSTPSCCNPAHLRWGTKLENTDDRERLGRRVRIPTGQENGNSKITPEIVLAIRASDEPQRALAKRFGVSQAWVSRIKRREVWAHLP